jgi:predicted transcriptional regulator
MHRGEILKKAIQRSPYSITTIAKRLGKVRETLYNWFENPDLDIERMLEIGQIIGYDFSHDLESDLLQLKVLSEPKSDYGKLQKCEVELKECMRKMIDLLSENNRLKDKIIELSGR